GVVGPKLAQKIVMFRLDSGGIIGIDDFVEVKGIGLKLAEEVFSYKTTQKTSPNPSPTTQPHLPFS
ncbi:MAG: hypothetical protein D3923_05315, partial [Candidatus Electrothrix sp. AR3]|nr:hypothetical protein [Candidatus Electrothrix sp. AR3]